MIMVANNLFLPKVSVVIPIYNGEKDLSDLLQCLRSQFYPLAQTEYLLVDNNSRDRTFSLIEKAVSDFPELTIYPLQEKAIQSAYAARNLGMRAAQGDIIVFTDADCRPEREWLTNLIPPFDDDKIGIVAGEIIALPGNSILEKYADRQNILSQKYTISHGFCPYGQTANLAIRRDLFKQIGLFRPHLTTGGDADICWRILRETNYQFQFVENALVKHRHRQSLSELRKQWERYGKSHRYLHELYGIDLSRELTITEIFYRGSRWLLKELPGDFIKLIYGKADLVDLLKTPIDLICAASRSHGQKCAKLSDLARQIELWN